MEVNTALGFLAHQGFVPVLAETARSNSQMLLIIVVLGVSATMIISARRRRSHQANSPRAYAREQLARLRDESAIREDLGALLVQVEEVTRQMNAQMDTKFRKLERVIRDADERAARLDRLLRAAEGRPICDVTVGDDHGETLNPPPEQGSDGGREARGAQVYQLADAGHSPVEIAEQTGQRTGEVELILALRPKSRVPPGG